VWSSNSPLRKLAPAYDETQNCPNASCAPSDIFIDEQVVSCFCSQLTHVVLVEAEDRKQVRFDRCAVPNFDENEAIRPLPCRGS
jgi:hypothetical protein